jgi:hypothetical protein
MVLASRPPRLLYAAPACTGRHWRAACHGRQAALGIKGQEIAIQGGEGGCVP